MSKAYLFPVSKLIKNVIFCFLLVFFSQCNTPKNTTFENNTIWVDYKKSDCENKNNNCFKIIYSDTLNINSLFSSSKIVTINNFTFEEGYYTKLKIEKTDENQVNFISVVDKKYAPQMFLTGKWKLIEINGKKLNQLTANINIKYPIIDIDVLKNSFSGNDGCNNLGGQFSTIDSEKIIFSEIFSTKMACIDMTIPSLFHSNIKNVEGYKVENDILFLFNKENKVLFKLQQN